MKYTKKELEFAMLLLLNETLLNIRCKKIELEGNSNCHRCDICMMNQYIKRVQDGEVLNIIKKEGK